MANAATGGGVCLLAVINSGILHRSFRLDDGRAGLFYGQGDLLRRRA
jgi:hypothetical protein